MKKQGSSNSARLSPHEAKDFLHPYTGLLLSIADQAPQAKRAAKKSETMMEVYHTLRGFFLKDPISWIDMYLANPKVKLSQEDRTRIHEWKRCHFGNFYLVRALKREVIFCEVLSTFSKFYAVRGITDPIEDIIPPRVVFTCALLPWNGGIVCDGIFGDRGFYFGSHINCEIHESYGEAKQDGSIIRIL